MKFKKLFLGKNKRTILLFVRFLWKVTKERLKTYKY